MSQALVEMAHVDASEDEQSELDELERLKSSPLRVSGIVFPQDFKTRSEKVLREFKPTVSAKTLEEVLKHTDETLVNLEDLGVFHEIDAEIVQGRSVRFHPTDPILLTAISFPVTALTDSYQHPPAVCFILLCTCTGGCFSAGPCSAVHATSRPCATATSHSCAV